LDSSDVKIYISVDFEGGACIVGQPEMTLTVSKQYEFARKVMTGEANAAADGAFQGGATEVIVDDNHGSGMNLLYDELDPRVRVVLGTPRPMRFQSLDETFAGILLVGFHPMAGVERGVLSHSYSSVAIQNMWLNERKIGEIGLTSALAGSLGVPTLLVTSCEEGVREAKDFLGEIETVTTKKGFSRNCALSLVPPAARELIRETAKRAVENRSRVKPFVVPGPYELKREYKFESFVDRTRPPAERVDSRTTLIRGENLFDMFRP
jgi:D-amino peptidase